VCSPKTLVLIYVTAWCYNPDVLNMKVFMLNFILVHIIHTASEDKIEVGVHVTICKEKVMCPCVQHTFMNVSRFLYPFSIHCVFQLYCNIMDLSHN